MNLSRILPQVQNLYPQTGELALSSQPELLLNIILMKTGNETAQKLEPQTGEFEELAPWSMADG